MWSHMQPHLFHNESSLIEQMILNKKFALVSNFLYYTDLLYNGEGSREVYELETASRLCCADFP